MPPYGNGKAQRPASASVPEATKASEAIAKGFCLGSTHEVEIVKRRVHRVVAYRGYGIPETERQDVEQEILAQLWSSTKRPEFDFRSGFWGFVELVATRRCIDWRRVHSKRRHSPLETDPPDSRKNVLQESLSAERLRLVSMALEKLGNPCRQLIKLHFSQRAPYRELAQRFGKSEGALRMQMVRCIRSIRGLLVKLEQSSGSASLQGQRP